MTTPAERTKAVLCAELMLCRIVAEGGEVFDSTKMRDFAAQILENFPRSADLLLSSSESPHIWGPPELLSDDM